MTLAILYHLAQFLIIQEVTDKTSVILNLNIEWNQVIPIEINIPNESFFIF